MKKRSSFLLAGNCILLTGLGLLLLLITPIVSAQAQTIGCPPGYPEDPIIQNHINQSDIASGALSFEQIFDAGQLLFEAKFNICDGFGRPATTGGSEKRVPDEPLISRISGPEANACAGCHNTPRAGGSGDVVANVFVIAQMSDPVLTSDDPQTSNFRNTPGMFGSGAIEMLAREMTSELLALRNEAVSKAQSLDKEVSIALIAKGISFGTLTAYPNGTLDTSDIEGLDEDLIIKPFHQAGRVISLREFTNNAMNHHHGMQSEERFDLHPDRGVDFDEDGISHELTIGDITAVTIWQASLGTPGQVLPDDREGQAEIRDGERLFSVIGCATCHLPELKLNSSIFVEPNPFNLDEDWRDESQSFSFDLTTTGEGPYLEKNGNGAIVRAFTDLKRHNLCDEEIDHFCNENLAQGRIDQDGIPGAHFFLTAKLWDAGNSAPYGHVGDLSTLTEAILAHGGEGRMSRDAFADLSLTDQKSIIGFLKSLQVLPEGMKRVVTESDLRAEAKIYDASLPSPQTNEVRPASTINAPVPGLGVIIMLIISVLGLGVLIGRQSRV